MLLLGNEVNAIVINFIRHNTGLSVLKDCDFMLMRSINGLVCYQMGAHDGKGLSGVAMFDAVQGLFYVVVKFLRVE